MLAVQRTPGILHVIWFNHEFTAQNREFRTPVAHMTGGYRLPTAIGTIVTYAYEPRPMPNMHTLCYNMQT